MTFLQTACFFIALLLLVSCFLSLLLIVSLLARILTTLEHQRPTKHIHVTNSPTVKIIRKRSHPPVSAVVPPLPVVLAPSTASTVAPVAIPLPPRNRASQLVIPATFPLTPSSSGQPRLNEWSSLAAQLHKMYTAKEIKPASHVGNGIINTFLINFRASRASIWQSNAAIRALVYSPSVPGYSDELIADYAEAALSAVDTQTQGLWLSAYVDALATSRFA